MLKDTKAFSSFSVKDLNQAKDFYQGKLGLNYSEDEPMTLSLKVGDQNNVLIYEKENHIPATFTVLNFLVNDVESVVDDLSNKGIKFEIYPEGELQTDQKGIHRNGGPVIAWFKDPAGNFISLVEDHS
jgi:catechol 2,3-dioxygenase-like lactoylglutathione lyase family enzyme